jgi:Acetyltransferase (GNAT) domain
MLKPWSTHCSPNFIAHWDRLSADAAEANPFYESWFLRPSLQQFDPDSKIKLAVMWAGEPDSSDMIGIMPIVAANSYGRWPLPHSTNWLHYNAFLGTPLVRRGYEHMYWRALLSAIDGETKQGLFFHINGLDVDGDIASALQDVAIEQGRVHACVHKIERALLTPVQSSAHSALLSSAEYYEQNMRAKKRKELRRQKNRLAELGLLSFDRQTDAAGLVSWIAEFLELEQAGWKGAATSALANAPQTSALFSDALIGAAAQQKLERLTLRLDGRAIAMLVNFHCAGGSFSFKTAFDETLASYSPGVLLQIENLDMLNNAKFTYCDSCAAPDHPMIGSIWSDRRTIGRCSVAIGGGMRRFAFSGLLRAEQARSAMG